MSESMEKIPGQSFAEDPVQEPSQEIEEEKHFDFTISTKDKDFSLEDAPFEELNLEQKEIENVFGEVGEIVEQENDFFEKFTGGRNIIEEIIIDTEDDNYFSLERKEEEPRAIKVPGKDNETLETIENTKPIVRHEAFHHAMRLENLESLENTFPWLEIEKNIIKGNDTKLPFVEEEIKTSKFQKFTGGESVALAFLDAMVWGAHPNQDIRELIEEKLADYHMFSQEISKNGLKDGVEIATEAKIAALDIIAKNKGVENYKEMPSSTESYYGLINGRNTLISLIDFNKKSNNLSQVKELSLTVEGYEKKIEEYLAGLRQDKYAEAIGYEDIENLSKDNGEFMKSFDKIL